jgi:undecaprenyl-diphosphatase
LWVTAGCLVLLIGLSRLYLGVHFPHDLLGGWLVALLVLFIFVRTEEKASIWFNAYTLAAQIGIGFALSLAIALGGWLVGGLIADVSDPAHWAHFATAARSFAEYMTVAGALFGAVSGYVLMKRYARFRTEGTWPRKAGRYLLGIIGAIVLLVGLDLLFAPLAVDASTLGYLLRYVRYAAVAFWGLFGAPWVFLRLSLAKPVARSTGV